jgi:RHS repeat-associated protein
MGSQSYTYDASGNRTSAGSDNYTIDNTSNRLLQTATTAPNRSYDAAGNLTGDGTLTYTYSDRGRLKSVQQGTTVTNYAYNGLGQRVMKIGATDASITHYVYDEQGRLLGEYDFYGRPLQETVYLGDMPVAVLTQAISAPGTGIVQVDNTDTTKIAVVGSWPASTAIAGFAGTNYQTHVASAGTDSFTWKLTLPTTGKYYFQARWTADATRASTATYTATGTDGVTTRIVDQKLNNNTWVNIGLKTNSTVNNVATIKLGTSSLGTVSADMVRAVPVTAVTTNINYVFTDHLNTPRVITRASDNQMVWRWDQADPFGVIQPNANPAGLGIFTYNPRFPGQLYDAETGLYYNYHRQYSPSTGSYTQSDPIGLQGGINTYAYVNGNPVNAVDPTGLLIGVDDAAVIIGGGTIIIGGCIATNCGDGMASAAKAAAQAASSAVQAVKEFCENKKDDDKCGPDSRLQAELKAYAFAGIPLGGAGCDPVPWSDYNNKNTNGYAQARRQGVQCMGYRSQNSKARVEEHPGGHNDDNAPHHDCPHFHATQARHYFSRKLKWDPSDFSSEKSRGG